MAEKKGNYQIPFDRNGNQQDYPSEWYVGTGEFKPYSWKDGEYEVTRAEGPNWVDNFEFEDTLTLNGFGRGRSSVTFSMVRSDGTTVSVFVSDFYDMAVAGAFKAGKIKGRFTFCKKGQNYGCRMVKQ